VWGGRHGVPRTDKEAKSPGGAKEDGIGNQINQVERIYWASCIRQEKKIMGGRITALKIGTRAQKKSLQFKKKKRWRGDRLRVGTQASKNTRLGVRRSKGRDTGGSEVMTNSKRKKNTSVRLMN